MGTLITILFIAGYAAIAFEHPLKINKTASALLTGVLCWVIYIMASSRYRAGYLNNYMNILGKYQEFCFSC